jgi:endoglycosylceramidase
MSTVRRLIVATLARHGIVSLLDFHQDQYSERFPGEGFPAWSVQRSRRWSSRTRR